MSRSTTCCWPKYRRPVARYVGRPAARSSSSYASASVPAANSSTISPGAAAPVSTSPRTRRAICRASARRQRSPRLAIRLAVGDEQLDRMAEDRVGELARRRERLEAVAELGLEEVVHGREHLGPRAVVLRQRQPLRRRRAALAEDVHVGVPEPVDRLELVADEEDVLRRRPAREQVDELALERVRVLELVDHDRPEAELLGLADPLVVAEEVAREELEVLEVERRLGLLRRRVRRREQREQLLEELLVVRGEDVEARPARPASRAHLNALARPPLVASVPRSSSSSGSPGRSSAARAAARCRSVASGSSRSARASRRRSSRSAPTSGSGPSSSASGRPAERSVSYTPVSIRRSEPLPYVASSRTRRSSPSAQKVASARSNASPRRTAPCSSSSSRKRGSIPAANGCARSSRAQKPWIVEIHAPSRSRARSCRPDSTSALRIRARSSPAAFRVYVIASTESTSSPSSRTARTNRSTSTDVLPVPAPAETKTSPRASTAASCRSFTRASPGTSSRGRTTPGTRRHAGRARRRRAGSAARARAPGRAPPRPAPRTHPRRGSRSA